MRETPQEEKARTLKDAGEILKKAVPNLKSVLQALAITGDCQNRLKMTEAKWYGRLTEKLRDLGEDSKEFIKNLESDKRFDSQVDELTEFISPGSSDSDFTEERKRLKELEKSTESTKKTLISLSDSDVIDNLLLLQLLSKSGIMKGVKNEKFQSIIDSINGIKSKNFESSVKAVESVTDLVSKE